MVDGRRSWLVVLVLVYVFGFVSVVSAQQPTFSMVPARATGATLFDEVTNTMHVEPGARVFFEVMISTWSTTDGTCSTSGIPCRRLLDCDFINGETCLGGPERLQTVQARLDLSTLSFSGGGTLSLPLVPCVSPVDCVVTFGVFGPGCGGNGFCDALFHESSRPDFVLDGINSVGAVDNVNFRAGYTMGNPAAEQGPFSDGSRKYFATLALDVSNDADGAASMGLIPGPETFVTLQDGTNVQDVIVVLGHVEIGVPAACCLPDGSCAEINSDDCAVAGGAVSPVAACSGDGNGNGIDDVCESDCNSDGLPDIDETEKRFQDCDLDGICNGVEINQCDNDPDCLDCDNDDVPDGCQPDCNGNDINDVCDLRDCDGSPWCMDCDGNGVPDGCQPDCDGDGVANACEILNCAPLDEACSDCDENGVPDGCQPGGCCLDPDQDGVFEACAFQLKETCELGDGIFRGPCRNCPDQNADIILEPGGEVFVHVIGPPIDCIAETGGVARVCSPSDPKFDVWKSDANASMCHNFGVTGHEIPAGFFGEFSEAYTGTICFEGEPLGVTIFGEFGDADTIIARTLDPFDRCALPEGGANPQVVQIEVVALQLVGLTPIVATFTDGSDPVAWNVSVELSDTDAPASTLTAIKTHCNGGTYTSQLNVQPKFIFSKVDMPATVLELDTAAFSIPHVSFDQQDPAPWVHDVDPELGLTGDECTSFHAGITDPSPVLICDCDGNSRRDQCDIEDTAGDCNGNGVLDKCEAGETSLDCNGNLIPDECEPDCNLNSIADACDITAGAADDNTNGIPDLCERGVAAPTGDTWLKNRCVSFRPSSILGQPGAEPVQALRITTPDVPSFEKWVTGLDANRVASLTCSPDYQSWGFAMVHVCDEDIVPNASYFVQGIAEGGDVSDEVAYSQPPTALPTIPDWGDVAAKRDVVTLRYTPPDGIVDFTDIEAVVACFKSLSSAPVKPVCDLVGGEVSPAFPDRIIDFRDIQFLVGAFKSDPFPFDGPAVCE